MPRSHYSKKQRIIMTTAGVLLVAALSYCLLNEAFSLSAHRGRGSSLSESARNNETDTLQLLHVVFRHGPRTPADTYPNDPYVNETFYPSGWGQITNDGKRQLYNVGLWLRRRYGKFLGNLYMPDNVHAQATGVSRTHMSMQTVLASLFQPRGTAAEWSTKLNWQPIPVYSQPLDEDTLLLVRTPCPRYYEALEEVYQLPEVKAAFDESEQLFKDLSKFTGYNVTNSELVQDIYTTLLAEKEFGLSLPAWTKGYFPEKMQFLAEINYMYNIYTTEMQRIKAGPFLQKMFDEWKAKIDGTLKPSARKLFIYTGHDSTVVNFLMALKIWERQLPKYAVTALFELHKNKQTGEYYVQIYMRNDTKGDAKPLTIPGCDFKCPVEKLIKLAADVLPKSDQCKAKNSEFTEPPPSGP